MHLGKFYELGLVVKKDLDIAFKFYKHASYLSFISKLMTLENIDWSKDDSSENDKESIFNEQDAQTPFVKSTISEREPLLLKNFHNKIY